MKKILIIDTFNLLHRAYHALPTTFRGPDGSPTNAVYGVSSMIINLLETVKPNYIAAAMDGPEPTFRSEGFTAYKAQRKPMEEDLASQIDKVEEILDAFGIKRLLVNGYEADDLIGTVSTKFKGDNEVIILSNDRDMWQLVDKNVLIMLPNTKGNFEWVGSDQVKARMGFGAELIPDYKGLRGDPSDNIPGVYGVGEKTAQKLIVEFGTVEDIYKNIEKVTPLSLKEKLLNSYEIALQSKQLATIVTDVPVELNLDSFKYSEFNLIEVKKVLEKYNFKSLIKRLGFDVKDTKPKSAKYLNDNQQGLF